MPNNVVFKDIRKTVKVTLPSYPNSEVELYSSLLFGQVNELNKKEMNDIDRGVLSLQYLIKDWNFTDEDGKKLPITMAVLNQFPLDDLTLLLEKVSDFFTKDKRVKKKPSKT